MVRELASNAAKRNSVAEAPQAQMSAEDHIKLAKQIPNELDKLEEKI